MGVTAWPDSVGGIKVDTQDWGETGYAYKGYLWRVVIHSTETGSWPGYKSGKNQPHQTLMWNTFARLWMLRQHQSLNIGARALLGTSTNTANALQVEIVGTCDKEFSDRWGYLYLPNLTAEQRLGLGRYLIGLASLAGIDPGRTAVFAPYPQSYGNGPGRMNRSQWLNFTGLCEHQNVYANDHGDAGALPVVASVTEAAAQLGVDVSRDQTRRPPRKNPQPKSKYSRHGLTVAEVKSVQKALNEHFGAGLVVDGSYGPLTTAAVKSVQKVWGLPQDGVWGNDTQAAYEAWKRKKKPPQPKGLRHKIMVDGRWGEQTTEQLQRHFGTPVDGEISSQPDWGLNIFGLEVVKNPKGSPLVRAIQRAVGADDDGKLGPQTIKAMQRHFGTPPNGEITLPRDPMVVAMQRALNDDEF